MGITREPWCELGKAPRLPFASGECSPGHGFERIHVTRCQPSPANVRALGDKLQLETKMALGNEASLMEKLTQGSTTHAQPLLPRETETQLLLLLQARPTFEASAVSMVCLT